MKGNLLEDFRRGIFLPVKRAAALWLIVTVVAGVHPWPRNFRILSYSQRKKRERERERERCGRKRLSPYCFLLLQVAVWGHDGGSWCSQLAAKRKSRELQRHWQRGKIIQSLKYSLDNFVGCLLCTRHFTGAGHSYVQSKQCPCLLGVIFQ